MSGNPYAGQPGGQQQPDPEWVRAMMIAQQQQQAQVQAQAQARAQAQAVAQARQQAAAFAQAAAFQQALQQPQEQQQFNGTELVMLYSYQAQAPDNLTLERGDLLYTDLSNQSVEGWLWSYAPTARKFGFVPRAYVGRRQ